MIIKELNDASESVLDKILAFIKKIKEESEEAKSEPLITSESSLKKDWLSPEEDEAWKDL